MTHEWKDGEALTADLMNTAVRDEVRTLFRRPRVTKVIPGQTTLTNTTFKPVDDSKYKFELTTFGGDILILLTGSWRAVYPNAGRMDLFVDDTYYLSSLTSTPLSWGWGLMVAPAGTIYLPLPGIGLLENMSAGKHTLSIHALADAGTVYIGRTTGSVVFTAMEIG